MFRTSSVDLDSAVAMISNRQGARTLLPRETFKHEAECNSAIGFPSLHQYDAPNPENRFAIRGQEIENLRYDTGMS